MSANERQIGGYHYKTEIEHWDYVIANDIPYLEAQVIKYLTRWRKKNGFQDVEKAKHFLDKLIEVETAKIDEEKPIGGHAMNLFGDSVAFKTFADLPDYCSICDTVERISGPCKHQKEKQEMTSHKPEDFKTCPGCRVRQLKTFFSDREVCWTCYNKEESMVHSTEDFHQDQYVLEAARTDTDRTQRVVDTLLENAPNASYLLHSVIGMMGELGELASALEKWMFYGQEQDVANTAEELGDIQWYLAQAHRAMKLKMSQTQAANIEKLKKRYPEKYEDGQAKEENRDRKAEQEAADKAYASHFGKDYQTTDNQRRQTGQGFAEPPEIEERTETGYDVARRIVRSYLPQVDQRRELDWIDRLEREAKERC